MDELSAKSKELLHTFAESATPDAAAVETALASMGPAAHGPGGDASGMPLAAKALGAGIAGVVVAVLVWPGEDTRVATQPAVAPTISAPVVPDNQVPDNQVPDNQVPDNQEDQPVPQAVPEVVHRAPEVDGAPSPEPAQGGSKQRRKRTDAVSEAAVPADDLARQMQMMSTARRALNRREHRAALKVLKRYAREFRDGAFAEQAAALEVDTLCGLGRVDAARAAARRFVDRWPRSPSAARVRQACSTDTESPGPGVPTRP